MNDKAKTPISDADLNSDHETLIESFVEVCLPDQFLVNMLYDLQNDIEGDLHSDVCFKWIQNYFQQNISVLLGSKIPLNLK